MPPAPDSSPELPPRLPGGQAEHTVELLLALNQAAIAITGELELDSLLQRIVDTARDIARCEYSALGVLGDDGFIARFPTSGISQVDREKLGTPPRGHGLLGVMLRAGRTLRIPDINKDNRRVGFPPHHPEMTSLLGVPIFVRGKLVGDLYLTNKFGAPEFNEEDEWLLQLLATHAATALTNAQLLSENLQALADVSRERGRAQALLRITQAITGSVQMEKVIPVILESAVSLLGAAGAAVFLLERSPLEATDEAYVAARYSIGLGELPTNQIHLPIEGSVAGQAIASGQTQIVPDSEAETRNILTHLSGTRAVKSLVVVPLITGKHTLGVFSVYSDRKGAFDVETVELIEAFGAQASITLFNAQLYEQAERGRKAAELEQQRLRELEQMKDEFLSTAAHELRTPLTSITMSAGLAHEQIQQLVSANPAQIDKRLVNLISLILEGSARMHALVNDLLDLTRLEQGRAMLAFDEIDLRDVVKESVAATMPLFESKGQTLAMRLPETYCGVRGDSRRLEQAVVNLLSNASKYSPGGSQAEIRVVRSSGADTAGECKIMVRDSGPGVPVDEQETVFERFYRSSIHRQDRTPSTGLGLPITRQIVELHGGRAWVESAQGGGSLFAIALPLSH